MNRKKFLISITILIIDQITKLLVQTYETSYIIIKDFFAITYHQNTGAAWSILEGKTGLLIFLTMIMIVIAYSMMFSFKTSKITNIAFGLLFGGIIGNFIDRLFFGFVRDFISIIIFNYHFPIFNIADMAIVIGAVILIILSIKGDEQDGNNSRRKLVKDR